MSDREAPDVAEAARLLDDMTQQIIPVPPFLDQEKEKRPAEAARPTDSRLDGHVL
ncbi:hypothetical protein HFP15_21120 [Amycolatopsis sp. K13G38]|uniref:Uncharacterized protein n=1 Tax=Amycolatopsis acididurans TaxID=2724524 RepID=A0ABX1J925_9PSEU|nr:hypothetical protein [Amycolatopsis acididurans]NKQ55389.1 hypothetical protein [Amycolatopsis acididurans]